MPRVVVSVLDLELWEALVFFDLDLVLDLVLLLQPLFLVHVCSLSPSKVKIYIIRIYLKGNGCYLPLSLPSTGNMTSLGTATITEMLNIQT